MKGINCIVFSLVLVATNTFVDARPPLSSATKLKILLNKAKHESMPNSIRYTIDNLQAREFMESQSVYPDIENASGLGLYMMIDRELSKLHCNVMISCYLKTWYLRSVLLKLNETHPGMLHGTVTYEDYLTDNNILISLVMQYVEANRFPNPKGFQVDVYPECTDYYLRRCHSRLTHFAIKHCRNTLKVENMNVNCRLNHTSSDWVLLNFLNDYVEGNTVIPPKRDFYVAQFQTNDFFFASRCSFVRMLPLVLIVLALN